MVISSYKDEAMFTIPATKASISGYIAAKFA
jgi:hypothetical protein